MKHIRNEDVFITQVEDSLKDRSHHGHKEY